MPNVTISPNMGLPVPNVGVDVGPDWANNLNACLSVVDGHSHVSGSGVQITPAAININADLPFNNTNNLVTVRSLRLFPNTLPIAASSPDLGCIYEAGVDLYYNDGNGNQIRITQGGSVAGASGTITGLPSGTASASFSAATGTFIWGQATSTAANMDAATLILRYPGSYPTPAGKYISIQAPSSLATGFSFTLPNNTPSVNQSALVSDTSGNISYMNPDDIGSAMTSTGADAVANSRTRSVGATVGIGGVAISSGNSGLFSTSSGSFVDVTNLTVTITTSGRPVFLTLIPDISNTTAYGTIYMSPSDSSIQFVRGSTALGIQSVGGGATTAFPCSSVIMIDAVGAGTYSYKLQVAAFSGSIGVYGAKLVAYEL